MKFTFSPESRVLDGYTIKRAIYRGGFGEVYYALSDAGREVALKLLQNNTEVELRGVQQCLNLSHPNLVTIFDVREDGDGDHWIIMEFVGGETLDAAIRRHPDGMPMEVIRRWLPGITAGIAFLHSRGLVHRDLKPANVFSDSGVVKIGDVGLSKFITPSRRSAQTQSVGTVYYMAPEVARGRYGKEVDTYALGIILYEMLTGRVPFDGESAAEILMKHLSQTPDLTRLPPRLRPVIARALEKDPVRRHSSIEALAAEFENAVLGKAEASSIGTPVATVTAGPPEAASAAEQCTTQPTGRVSAPCGPDSEEAKNFAALPWQQRAWPTFYGWCWVFGLALVVMFGSRTAGREAVSYLLMGLVIGYLTYISPRLFARREWPFDLQRWKTESPPGPAVGPSRSTKTPPNPVIGPRPVSNLYAPRQRLTQWLTSATISTGLVMVFTAGISVVAPSLLSLKGGDEISPEAVALFAGTSIVGAWLVTLAVKVMDFGRPRHPEPDGSRRLALLFAGLATGAAAWGLGVFLQLDGATQLFAGQRVEGVFRALGERPLLDGKAATQFPTLLGYMVFFGGLFGLRSWWRQIELQREGRFYSSSVLMTVFVAWLWSGLFVFPQTWAMLWAAMISTTAQLAAPWSPRSSLRGVSKP